MFEIMFTIVPIIIAVIWVFTIAMIFSPKLRAKFMGKQLKATKYMLDENKENLADMASTVGDITIDSTERIINENEEQLRNISTKKANISKEGIETTVRAIKKGLTEDVMFCKYCGQSIDSDSRFCKSCGKEQ